MYAPDVVKGRRFAPLGPGEFDVLAPRQRGGAAHVFARSDVGALARRRADLAQRLPWREPPDPTPTPVVRVASFSRNVEHEGWEAYAHRAGLRRTKAHRALHPNLLLTYSLPDLQALKCAVNYERAAGREPLFAEPEENEELYLSLHDDLLHPRMPSAVPFEKQTGRGDIRPAEEHGEEIPDEVLELSVDKAYEFVRKRKAVFVDMSRGLPRATSFDAHLHRERGSDGQAYALYPS